MNIKKPFSAALVVALLGSFAVTSAGIAAYEAEKGIISGKVKTLNEKGHYKRVSKAKVYLLSYKNKTVKKKDKTNSKGKYKFKNLTAGKKYRIKCKKSGYVNAKNPAKSRYISGKLKVKAGKTVRKSCKLQLAN